MENVVVVFFGMAALFKMLLQFLGLVFPVISQPLITEQVRLQPLRVPATACSSDTPSAKINRSSSLHITTYQEEE